jgi:hypothetical protein
MPLTEGNWRGISGTFESVKRAGGGSFTYSAGSPGGWESHLLYRELKTSSSSSFLNDKITRFFKLQAIAIVRARHVKYQTRKVVHERDKQGIHLREQWDRVTPESKWSCSTWIP